MAVEFNPAEYWNNRLGENYNLMGVGDISLTMNYNKWSYRVTRIILKKILHRYSPALPGHVLDIGAGTGFVVSIWISLKKMVTGIDISANAVSNLKKNFPDCSFYELDAGTDPLPFSDNSIQAVSAASVLYHVIEDSKLEFLLSNIHRVLEPGGVFVFSDNFIHGSNVKMSHQKCRSLEDYHQFLEKAGFQIIKRSPNYVLFNDPVDANGKFFPMIWSRLIHFSKKWKWFDAVIWCLLFPVELLLTSLLKESPAQEFMICKAVK